MSKTTSDNTVSETDIETAAAAAVASNNNAVSSSAATLSSTDAPSTTSGATESDKTGANTSKKTSDPNIDDALVDPELNNQSQIDEDVDVEDDDQINQIEDDASTAVVAAAAAAVGDKQDPVSYIANMQAVESHMMQNVLGAAAAGSPKPSVTDVDSVVVDYNDVDEESKTALDAIAESNRISKPVSTTKRAAQNRAAQRAFRQRRKTRIENLEHIELLYKSALQDVERLHAENEILKKKLAELK